ncbi:hypothetical protein DAPPUDRAFT_232694 [Daphnia pulex]|uniref:Uncharacterized protein n=1 Tax=Daphnia pulex TaxID=6669 RepID=E9FRF2_DAPPU|nr:hypothetical protein DAPPUDRAFT_232694 [Daphnia pulex]|eukprot:EFX90155.1 hypothetical protein DAPPUDRAFT_232694 [Daphnia pulex]
MMVLSMTSRYSNNTTLLKFSWFLYNITNLLSLLISAVFWAVLFVPGRGLKDKDIL